jgi:hypothetical protein
VSLAATPVPLQLIPGVPFALTAAWQTPSGAWEIAAEHGTGARHEYLVGGELAAQLEQISPEGSELPIMLQLGRGDQGQWRFMYLGAAGRALAPEELNQGAQQQLRESLGIPATSPLPTPQGPLPPDERPAEPLRFDPTPHMDLSRAEPPVPLPAPAPPGPPPDPAAQTAPSAPVPEPGRPLGSYGDKTVPFAH